MVDLYWLPLGAGGHFVKYNGRVYERLAAWLQRRPPFDLYHSALQVEVPAGRFVIEQAPAASRSGGQRGVVAEGPVGSRWAGRFRIFRYEIRLWNSNSVISWVLARSGLDVESIDPPGRGTGAWLAGRDRGGEQAGWTERTLGSRAWRMKTLWRSTPRACRSSPTSTASRGPFASASPSGAA